MGGLVRVKLLAGRDMRRPASAASRAGLVSESATDVLHTDASMPTTVEPRKVNADTRQAFSDDPVLDCGQSAPALMAGANGSHL